MSVDSEQGSELPRFARLDLINIVSSRKLRRDFGDLEMC